MSVGKLCGLAVIIVVICPVVLGFVWPTGTETVESWTAEPAIDVTGDLAERDIPVYDTYTGPLNNVSIYRESVDRMVFPEPRDTTATENPYPVSEIEGTDTASSIAVSDMSGTGRPRYGIGSLTGIAVSGVSGSFSYADYWPATNTMTLYDGEGLPDRTITPQMSDTLTGDLSIAAFSAPEEYVDTSAGLAGSSSPWLWVNGLHNRAAEIWLRMSHTPFSNSVMIDRLTLTWADGKITVTDGAATADLGSVYDFVSVRLDKDGATVTGLIGVDGFQDRTYTEGNRLVFEASGSYDYIAMKGSYMSWWVRSTESAIASTKGIEDAILIPEDYYGDTHAWQVQIINPSTFGDSLTVGSLTYPVTDGTITATNMITEEAVDMPVRGLRILSLVREGQQVVYLDGQQVMSAEPGSVAISLSGKWYASVVLAKVDQTTSEEFSWSTGGYGFDKTAFCLVGLMSCVAVAIAGTLWGRRSGESALALHITMIICAAAYYCLL